MVLNDFELAFAGLITYGNRLYMVVKPVYLSIKCWLYGMMEVYIESQCVVVVKGF